MASYLEATKNERYFFQATKSVFHPYDSSCA
jgi:hypothetical protein